jgi:drug/metabolite transporter (DMT)-like permease
MVIKIGLFSLPPFMAAGIRFLIAFFLLVFYAKIKELRFPKGLKMHFFFFWFGILNFTGGYALVYWGEKYIPSGLASVLFSVMPFYVLFLSIWFLPQEKIKLKKIIGVVLGFVGVIIIFADQLNFKNLNSDLMYGMTAVIVAPLFSSFGTITAKRVGARFHPVVLTTIPMLYSCISFFILALIFERQLNPIFDFNAIFSIIYLALAGTAIAFMLYFWMLRNTSAVLMSMITFITPPLALVWGWLLLDERISFLLVVGLISIFIGIILVRKS